MNFLKPFAVLLLVTVSLATENHHGTIPRADATAYPAYAMQNGIQVGAALLTHKETKKALATDVNQCCLVVEVAFYPPKDNFVKISPDDFMLREVGKDVGIGPSGADVLAARLEVIPRAPDREHRGGRRLGGIARRAVGRCPGRSPRSRALPPDRWRRRLAG